MTIFTVAVNHLTGRIFLKDRSTHRNFDFALDFRWFNLAKAWQIKGKIFCAYFYTKFVYHRLIDLHSGVKKVRKKKTFLFNSSTMFVCCL